MSLTEKIKARATRSEIVEVQGVKFKVSGLTLRERSEIFADCRKRKLDFDPAFLARCVRDAEDDSAATYEDWKEASADVAGPLMTLVMSVCGMDKDDLKRDPKDSSTTES